MLTLLLSILMVATHLVCVIKNVQLVCPLGLRFYNIKTKDHITYGVKVHTEYSNSGKHAYKEDRPIFLSATQASLKIIIVHLRIET